MLEDSNNVDKTKASIQTMIGPYRKWAGAQKRKGGTDYYNKGSGKGAPANNNNYNNGNNDGGGGGKGASVGKNNNDNINLCAYFQPWFARCRDKLLYNYESDTRE